MTDDNQGRSDAEVSEAGLAAAYCFAAVLLLALAGAIWAIFN